MAQDQDPVVIVAAARTPMGGFQGELAGVSATELGGIATLCIGGGEATAIAVEMC